MARAAVDRCRWLEVTASREGHRRRADIEPALLGTMLLQVVKNVDEAVPHLARRLHLARVVAALPDGPAARAVRRAQDAVDAAREANRAPVCTENCSTRNESRSFASVFADAIAPQMTPKSPRSRSVGNLPRRASSHARESATHAAGARDEGHRRDARSSSFLHPRVCRTSCAAVPGAHGAWTARAAPLLGSRDRRGAILNRAEFSAFMDSRRAVPVARPGSRLHTTTTGGSATPTPIKGSGWRFAGTAKGRSEGRPARADEACQARRLTCVPGGEAPKSARAGRPKRSYWRCPQIATRSRSASLPLSSMP